VEEAAVSVEASSTGDTRGDRWFTRALSRTRPHHVQGNMQLPRLEFLVTCCPYIFNHGIR
jgi:hypothetical protein